MVSQPKKSFKFNNSWYNGLLIAMWDKAQILSYIFLSFNQEVYYRKLICQEGEILDVYC